MIKSAITAMAIVGCAFASLVTSPAHAKPVNCDAPNGDLQNAIDESDVGATLDLSGNCEGPFFVTKSITLAGPATLSAPNGGFAVLLVKRGGDVTLKNLTVDASGANDIGIYVEGSTIDVGNVVVEGPIGEGIRLIGSSFGTIADSTVNQANVGISVIISSSAFLWRNTLENNNIGLLVTQNSAGAVFSGNDITENNIGVRIDSGATLQFDANNTVSNNGLVGINADGYGFVTFFGASTIENNGTDINCTGRAGYHTLVLQTSSTKTTGIPDAEHCLVQGDIFNPAP